LPEAVDIAVLQREKDDLAQQIKQLVKAEGKIYEYQEKLDAQLKEYKELYELTRKISASFDILETFGHAGRYIIYHLGYERVIFLEQFKHTGHYAVCTIDGYYQPEEREAVMGLVIPEDDPLLLPLHEGREYLICNAGSEQKELLAARAKLLMDEYLVYSLCSHKEPHAFLVVGNSAASSEFYQRVTDAKEGTLGMGNLVGLLISAVANHIFYGHMELALAQEKLAEEKYRGIFENALEGIYQTTREGRFISCNPATAAILGYDSPEEVIASVTDVEQQLYVTPHHRREMFDLMEHGRDAKNFEVEFYRKDGSKRWVMLSTRPVFDEQGKIMYVDGMLQDIAERKRAEMALQTLNEELEQRVIDRTEELESANSKLCQVTCELEKTLSELKSAQSSILQQEKMASIGQLAAGVAHEINNPMGFIISNLNSLKKYTDKLVEFMNLQSAAIDQLAPQAGVDAIAAEMQTRKKTLKIDYILEDLGDMVDESLDGAERVKKIVQDLKSFSRLDESELKPADINEGLESTLHIVWNDLKYKATVRKEYGDIPLTVCNLGQLNQVFVNLLINAAQAIETKGEILVKTTSNNDHITITIADTGIGIAADKVGRVFEPFYTTKEVGRGTGLGLSIAYDIVKKHKGEIWAESEVGKGTTFTISIPIVEE
jgi:PAS domain S-box-containing protein